MPVNGTYSLLPSTGYTFYTISNFSGSQPGAPSVFSVSSGSGSNGVGILYSGTSGVNAYFIYNGLLTSTVNTTSAAISIGNATSTITALTGNYYTGYQYINGFTPNTAQYYTIHAFGTLTNGYIYAPVLINSYTSSISITSAPWSRFTIQIF